MNPPSGLRDTPHVSFAAKEKPPNPTKETGAFLFLSGQTKQGPTGPCLDTIASLRISVTHAGMQDLLLGSTSRIAPAFTDTHPPRNVLNAAITVDRFHSAVKTALVQGFSFQLRPERQIKRLVC